jgi:hypothetical protein
MRVRMELFAKIRRDARVEAMSIRGLAKRYQVGRDTVRQAFSDPVPPARRKPVRSSPRLDPFKPAIDAMLTADTTAPRKQRHAAPRVLARPIEERAEELSYSTVRDYVRVRRAQIDVEAGRRVGVFVPQEHGPGAVEPTASEDLRRPRPICWLSDQANINEGGYSFVWDFRAVRSKAITTIKGLRSRIILQSTIPRNCACLTYLILPPRRTAPIARICQLAMIRPRALALTRSHRAVPVSVGEVFRDLGEGAPLRLRREPLREDCAE